VILRLAVLVQCRTEGQIHDDSIYRASITSRAKTDAHGITKRDIDMFHDESWISVYFGVKRSRSRGVGHGAFVSADFF